MSGSTTKTVRKITVIAMMTPRINLGSVRRSSRAEVDEIRGVFVTNVSTAAARVLSHAEKGYGLTVGCNPSPGSLARSDLSPWERRTRLVAAVVLNSFMHQSLMRGDSGLRPALDAIDGEDDQE